MKNKKLLIRLGITILFSSLIIHNIFFIRNDDIKNFKIFNQAEIKGEISYLYSSGRGEQISIDNKESKYRFYSIANDSSKGEFFYSIAEIGDSIIKIPYADFLTLKKRNGEMYKVYFRKLSE